MTIIHNLGFPRIGKKRELKSMLEAYWKKNETEEALLETGRNLRAEHYAYQNDIDLLPAGDFSFYDQVLDMSFLLGNIPSRIKKAGGDLLDQYFRLARGRGVNDTGNATFFAGEMTKWFDTNYHYIVPEFTKDTEFSLNAQNLLDRIKEARQHNGNVKPVIIGPLTYLFLGKSKDDTNKLDLLEKLVPVYKALLKEMASRNIEWVQIDEPALVTELNASWREAYQSTYHALADSGVKLLLTTYFGGLDADNLELATCLPVDGIHYDAVRGKENLSDFLAKTPSNKVISLGVIDGRNVWKTDLNALLDWLEPIYNNNKDRLWLAPSCSLLHTPYDLSFEEKIDPEIKSWLAFAVQKLDELKTIKFALQYGRETVKKALDANKAACDLRRSSKKVHNEAVKKRTEAVLQQEFSRQNPYHVRIEKQRAVLNLPDFPTTTIGSFPQTSDIRTARRDFKKGLITEAEYNETMQDSIRYCVERQEEIGIDVFVHGEAERNDMVEYFGERLDGYVFSGYGWVQSYGSRCVKPPIIFGDIARPLPMTVEWSVFAQNLTKKPMKAMLTGPVTILNWSFVRDDQPRRETCYQLAFALQDEVKDLEKAGLKIIQIDEPALREGLPLHQSEWDEYLNWAVKSFRISTCQAADETQIHTHMCYSEFNDIIQEIADLDADVITIETSRSDMELLDAFDDFAYPNDIGPGVYDIHSPNIPEIKSMKNLMDKACEKIPAERLWINPDCGLKTRKWDEVIPSLKNMVTVASLLREARNNKAA